jgi:hypothetical protein
LSFLFVGGAQRSGTTALQRLLCADHRTQALLPEASYLRMLVQAYTAAREDLEHDTAGYFDDAEDLRTFHSGLVYLFLERTLARHPQAERLVLKEPHLTPHFPALHGLVPEARFVVSARDPRDTIASMLAVGERMQAAGQAHFFQQRDMTQLARYVKSFYAPLLNAADPALRGAVLIVRYEDVVRGNAETLAALRGFTGLELDRPAAAEAVPAQGDATRPRYRPWYTSQSGRPLNPESIGRHRDRLSTDETASIERECADLMQALGYR